MRLKRGVCYLIEDDTPDLVYRLFLHLLPDLRYGFCVSRLHPEKVLRKLRTPEVRLGWLAEAPGEDHFSANAMAALAKAVQQFIQEHGSSGLVLIDGLEYVILHNGFQPTLLAFVEHLNEFAMTTQAIVLIAFRPDTLDPRELALLERNLHVLTGRDVKSQLDIEELAEVLGRSPAPAPVVLEGPSEVLKYGRGMQGSRVDTVRCAKCGTENAEDVAFCVYCGAKLSPSAEEIPEPMPEAPSAPAAPTAAVKPVPRTLHAIEPRPDFVALIGVAFFLLIVGIVFTLNANLLVDLGRWWDRVRSDGLFSRPPEGIVASGIVFFALLSLSNLLTAGLRWVLDRSRFGALARILAAVGFLALALLIWRYSLETVSGTQVLSIWTAVLGTLLVIYIAIGLYWVRVRRPGPAAAQAPTMRP